MPSPKRSPVPISIIQRTILQHMERQRQAIINNYGAMMHENSEKRGLAKVRAQQVKDNYPLPSWESYRAQQARDVNKPTYPLFAPNPDGTWRRVAPPPPRPIERKTKRTIDVMEEVKGFFVDPFVGPIRRLTGPKPPR